MKSCSSRHSRNESQNSNKTLGLPLSNSLDIHFTLSCHQIPDKVNHRGHKSLKTVTQHLTYNRVCNIYGSIIVQYITTKGCTEP